MCVESAHGEFNLGRTSTIMRPYLDLTLALYQPTLPWRGRAALLGIDTASQRHTSVTSMWSSITSSTAGTVDNVSGGVLSRLYVSTLRVFASCAMTVHVTSRRFVVSGDCSD